MNILPTTTDAYNLLHDGTLVMAEMEHNGIRVDMDYIHNIKSEIDKMIAKILDGLTDDEVYRTWKKVYKSDMNIDSRDQLADILFNKMGYASGKKLKTRYSVDVNVLEDLNLPFTREYIRIQKLKKAQGTYVKNIEFETVDGFIHPSFDLGFVRTYRGSSSDPNFQNMPMRDKLIKELIRKCFIAREGCHIVDLDFKGSEVNAAAWYHKDPAMLRYIETDPGRMHFDMAMACYMLPEEEMTDEIRYCGKNKFVFPQFYGDWWLSCAASLWRSIDLMNLKTKSGIPLKQWLAKKGIKSLGTGDPKNPSRGTFEAHIKDVEYDFWHNKFSVYDQWKKDWYEEYQDNGYFRMLSGFLVSGYLGRKEVLNYPIQGTAFHSLLWCLIRISQMLKKYRMKSLLIGQIHDDAVADVPDSELDDYIEICTDVITNQLKKHWSFIITPMRVEVEVTPIGGSWFDKKKVA